MRCHRWLNRMDLHRARLLALVWLVAAAAAAAAAAAVRSAAGDSLGSQDRWVGSVPIGVQPELAVRYESSSGQFACLDGNGVVAPGMVNDDFCDCDDGSDEPGTSACAGKSVGFWCANDGGEGHLVPSSRVNDGICDCCDGSDEFETAETCEMSCQQADRSTKKDKERGPPPSGRASFQDILQGLQIKRERAGLGADVAYAEKVMRLGRAETELHSLRLELANLTSQLAARPSAQLHPPPEEDLLSARRRRKQELGLLQQEPITQDGQRYFAQFRSRKVRTLGGSGGGGGGGG